MKEFLRRRVCESLNQILSRTEISEADLRDISDDLPVADGGFVKELFINERAFGVSGAEKFKTVADQVGARHPSVGRMIYRDQDLLEYLNRMDTNLAAMELPLSNGIPRLLEIEKEQKAEQENRIKANQHPALLKRFFSPRISLFEIIIPPVARDLLVEGTKNVAYERATLTAIAIERYRLSHAGHLPENLSALVPEYLASVPKDPFDDRELRFEKLERGYAVYSVGPDFTDDNGEPEPKEAKNAKHYDVVFSVTR